MAQIRSTMRAYAIDDPEPECVFTRVDRFFDALDVGQLVTAVYLLVDRVGGTVQVANAGHLAPLLVQGDTVERVRTPVGVPFGAGPDERKPVTVQLESGDSLLLLTDGLVERRGEDIDEGMARVTAAAAAADHRDARDMLRRIVEAGKRDLLHDDDVTVLVLRRH
jgi:serine phosphatase RsbU (regulator of sigma subunit)